MGLTLKELKIHIPYEIRKNMRKISGKPSINTNLAM